MTSSLFTPKTGLSNHEIECIIRRCEHPQFKLALVLMYQLGIRPSECLRIEVQHIQINSGLLTIKGPKGNVRQLPIPLSIAQQIPKLFTSSYLFANQKGTFYHLRSLQLEAKKAAKASGLHLRYGASSFRHAFAERMINEGLPLNTLQEWLGIQHEKSMRRYI